ncbi:MAG: hypothetical protein KC486_08260 [Myxococcales bacterium]|nr:hypothetical protein [Myxococcales bacterium]
MTSLMIVAWGVGGVLGLLANAVVRLWPLAVEPVRSGMMTPALWAAAAAWILFMAYTEGYRGFHRAFSPRVVARALWLSRNPRGYLVVLAPLFSMGLIHATKVRRIVSWTILIGVIVLVMIVRGLEQPWRGIVDSGVVVGLALGALSIAGHLVLALLGREPAIPPDVPEPALRD